MATVAPASKMSRQNALLVIVFFAAGGLYFFYDGWIAEKYQRQNIDWPFVAADIADPAGLAKALSDSDAPVATYIRDKLRPEGRKLLNSVTGDRAIMAEAFANELNAVVIRGDLYNSKIFSGVSITDETQKLIDVEEPKKAELPIRNRLLLMDAYSDYLAPGHWKDGRPNANLMFNRVYCPILCVVVIAYFLISFLRIRDRKIVADDSGLKLANGQVISYGDIQTIDKRFFDAEGHFTISYAQGDSTKQVKLTGRQYDGLAGLLEELVKRTGAAPAQ